MGRGRNRGVEAPLTQEIERTRGVWSLGGLASGSAAPRAGVVSGAVVAAWGQALGATRCCAGAVATRRDGTRAREQREEGGAAREREWEREKREERREKRSERRRRLLHREEHGFGKKEDGPTRHSASK